MKDKCFYCQGDLDRFLFMYGVNQETRISNRRFWKHVGNMCEDCYQADKPSYHMKRKLRKENY